jgi:hypothetical protein
VTAFGPAADVQEQTRTWCNLCRAAGDTYELVGGDDVMAMMQMHTQMRHPEHEAALRRGEHYEPVEVAP